MAGAAGRTWLATRCVSQSVWSGSKTASINFGLQVLQVSATNSKEIATQSMCEIKTPNQSDYINTSSVEGGKGNNILPMVEIPLSKVDLVLCTTDVADYDLKKK